MPVDINGNGTLSGIDIAGSGLGKILQVVRETDSGTIRSTTSSSFVDGSISVTITPQKSDSTILIVWSFLANAFGTSGDRFANFQITDNSNNALSGAEGSAIRHNAATNIYHDLTLIGYSTPATTSATTYKGRFKRESTGTTVDLRNDRKTGQMYAIEVSA